MVRFQFNDGGRHKAGYKGFAGDCVVRSIAIAMELPYQQVYDELFDMQREFVREKKLKSHHASPRSGVIKQISKDYIASKGWEWVPLMKIGSGCTTHLKAEELPSGRIIAKVSRHLVAVIDGVIHDTYDCSRNGTRCVYGFWRAK